MKPKIYENVKLGKNCKIEEDCEIGRPPRGKKDDQITLIIGDNALIRKGSVIYAGCKIGDNFETGHNVLIREGNIIGNNVSIGSNSTIEVDNIIGNNVRIHSLCFLECANLEDNVLIGPGTIFVDNPHPNIPANRTCVKGASIGRGSRIGGGVVLLPFITIGENSLIGAGSVVTKDVEVNAVVVGNPAYKIKNIADITCKRLGGRVHKPYKTSDQK